jgi:hypothetical protein
MPLGSANSRQRLADYVREIDYTIFGYVCPARAMGGRRDFRWIDPSNEAEFPQFVGDELLRGTKDTTKPPAYFKMLFLVPPRLVGSFEQLVTA